MKMRKIACELRAFDHPSFKNIISGDSVSDSPDSESPKRKKKSKQQAGAGSASASGSGDVPSKKKARLASYGL